MLILLIVLLVLGLIAAVIGFAFTGLIWLAIIAIVLFVGTGFRSSQFPPPLTLHPDRSSAPAANGYEVGGHVTLSRQYDGRGPLCIDGRPAEMPAATPVRAFLSFGALLRDSVSR
jgi:hypothetical protein